MGRQRANRRTREGAAVSRRGVWPGLGRGRAYLERKVLDDVSNAGRGLVARSALEDEGKRGRLGAVVDGGDLDLRGELGDGHERAGGEGSGRAPLGEREHGWRTEKRDGGGGGVGRWWLKREWSVERRGRRGRCSCAPPPASVAFSLARPGEGRRGGDETDGSHVQRPSTPIPYHPPSASPPVLALALLLEPTAPPSADDPS